MTAEWTPPEQDWHAVAGADALQILEAQTAGLSGAEAGRRLESQGPNRLPSPYRQSPLRRFLTQFRNVLIYMLLLAAAATALLQQWVDTGVIIGVVIINALIGFIQEGKAEKALDAIRDMLSLEATVVRDGRRGRVPAEEIVPGDIVVLHSGDKVPADMRLLNVKNLQVDEAPLTGESVPVDKDVEPLERQTALADRRNMAYSGTLVTYGQAQGVVVATGVDTEIGRISEMLAKVKRITTPLLQQMDVFGRWLTVGILAVSALAFALGMLLRDFGIVDMFMAAVAIAVAAIPEGLPAVLTITLALGVQRMAQRNAIIRRLPAVETLGAVNVICSDKTGTLTRNEMTVQNLVTPEREYEITGVGYEPAGDFRLDGRDIDPDDYPDLMAALRAGLLCNDANLVQREGETRLDGAPTEGALVTAALKAGLDRDRERDALPRTDVVPFESQHRFMATLHHDREHQARIYVKGAPEKILSLCSRQRQGGEDRPLDTERWRARIEQLADHGQRVLALACRTAAPEHRTLSPDDVAGDLVLLGLVGLIDPPREEAIAAVQECREAGIRVKMITGDHALTARAIGAKMGIGDGRHVVSGADLETLSDEELFDAAWETDVFARASPEHKLRLVRALQARRQVVAMTGDGVNDAPALKRADVGIAMGIKGTEVSKESAEMVLADDNFSSIANAVEEGRTVYDNIKKSILFILPTNAAEAAVVIAAIAFGVVLPITPVQILWVNMVTAVTLALSLAFEPPEKDIMQRPPRPAGQSLLTPFLVWRLTFVSAIVIVGTFGLFLWSRADGNEVEVARTVAVNSIVMFEVFYLFNTRHIERNVLYVDGLFGNRYVLLAVAAVLGLQMLFTYAPLMQQLFGSAPLALHEWGWIVLVASSVFVLVELEKALVGGRRRARTHREAPTGP